jgi:(p)ppGpp synthase/HD superfamily hydrolase
MTAGYSRDFDRALVLAALVHEGVPRKGTAIPYIIHPVHVATILLRHGYDEALAVAGVLHDVLEDVEYDNGRLQLAIRSAFPAASLPQRIVDAGTFRDAFQAFMEAEFAPDVLEFVRQVTEPKNDGRPRRSWRERKALTVQHLRTAPNAVVALKAADALHNVRSIVEDIAHHGATVLGRFSASRADTAWYYEEVSTVVSARLSSAPLAVELREAVRALQRTIASLAEDGPGR